MCSGGSIFLRSVWLDYQVQVRTYSCLLFSLFFFNKANLGAATQWFQLSTSWTSLCLSPLTSLRTPFPTTSHSPFWECQQRTSALRRLTMMASHWWGLVDRRETNSTSPHAPSLLTTWHPQLLLAFIRWRWPTDRGRRCSPFRSSTMVS